MKKLLENLARKLLVSLGVKRRLSALIAVLTGLAATTPELLVFVPALQAINAWLGGAALTHAAIAGTLAKPGAKAVSLASLLGALIGVIQLKVPELLAAVPLLQTLATVVGAFGLGVASVKTKK